METTLILVLLGLSLINLLVASFFNRSTKKIGQAILASLDSAERLWKLLFSLAETMERESVARMARHTIVEEPKTTRKRKSSTPKLKGYKRIYRKKKKGYWSNLELMRQKARKARETRLKSKTKKEEPQIGNQSISVLPPSLPTLPWGSPDKPTEGNNNSV